MHTVEAPCHQHFDNQENQNRCDVVLNGHCKHCQLLCCHLYQGKEDHTDVGMVLVVKEAPVNSHKEVEECYSSIKRQLGNLGSRELAVGVPKLDDGLVVARGELVREYAVVPSVLDVVFDRS